MPFDYFIYALNFRLSICFSLVFCNHDQDKDNKNCNNVENREVEKVKATKTMLSNKLMLKILSIGSFVTSECPFLVHMYECGVCVRVSSFRRRNGGVI